jgi:hypothetical protein
MNFRLYYYRIVYIDGLSLWIGPTVASVANFIDMREVKTIEWKNYYSN